MMIAMAAAALWTCAARAEWLPVPLPFGDALGRPATGVAVAGPGDVWATVPYDYRFQDDAAKVRWNTAVFHSRNDGLLWDLPFDATVTEPAFNKYPFQDVQLFAVSFADRDNGWLFGWRRPAYDPGGAPGAYVFYHTTDRGRTWAVSTLPNPGAQAPDPPDFAIAAVSPTHAIAVQGARVFETLDGAAWRQWPGTYPRLFAIQTSGVAVPRVAGVAAGAGIGGTITPNGVTTDVRATGPLYATAFSDALHGAVAGADGAVLATADGGATWKPRRSAPGETLHALAAPDALHLWAAGERSTRADSGIILRSQDGGATWAFDSAAPGRLLALAFRDAAHGFAAGEGGLYRYVPDGAPSPGDADRNGKVEATDAAQFASQAGGIRAASPQDVAPAGGAPSIVSAVAAARAAATAIVPAGGADRVVIVFNTASADGDGDGVPDSREVAQYYAARRGVPASHLVPVTWADPEAFQAHGTADGGGRANWTDAFHTVVEPLRAAIDAIGRSKVDTILFTFGVPYRFNAVAPDGSWETIPLDTAVCDLYRADAEDWTSAPAYSAPRGGLRYARARFAAGGRLLGQPAADAAGIRRQDPYYLVSRIDGPSAASCKAMVDGCIAAEKALPAGATAYIDTRASAFHGGPYGLDELRAWAPRYDTYADIDESIARTILTFADRGIPWRDEVTNVSIGGSPDGAGPAWRDGQPAVAAPDAMFYAGWYNYGTYHDAFAWLPGSVGIDYDSASAAGFRSGAFFAGGAMKAGLSCLVGVLEEPYQYHPKPDVLMAYLARGYSFAEAATLSNDTPRTGKALYLGDPLYRPFR